MGISQDGERLLFVVDTDTYAGNFEREMCAYITGQVGECEVGEEIAKAARMMLIEQDKEALEFFDEYVLPVADEHGCSRPVTIFTTPGRWNDGMGGEYPDGVEPTDPAVIERYNKAVERERRGPALSKPGKYSAYDSVAIFLLKEPPEAIRTLMMRRAQAFLDAKIGRFPPKDVHITGFRLLKRHVEYSRVWEEKKP
jgi:hypothetical protein